MRALRLALCLAACLAPTAARAVTGVHPTGVNVRASGPSTVFLTFQNLDPNERAVEAFWCGAVQPGVVGGSVTAFDPCVPGTLYGRLLLRLDQSRLSQAGALTNLTDIMTIPASVARRAYQDAVAGQPSDFFYVRRFTGGLGGDRYVVVTCRMSAGGARTPLALLDVRLTFGDARGETTVLAVARGERLPPLQAELLYNGSGELRGRWEVVMPGDPPPRELDLLTEATLPPEQRLEQRRYTLVDRFSVFLTPAGRYMLTGPDPSRLPTAVDGPYQVLLRIEATDDKEGQSQLGTGAVAVSGGVAGFPLPVARYYVGSPELVAALPQRPPARVELMLPMEDGRLNEALPAFSWIDVDGAALYRLEVEAGGALVLSALVRPGVSNYVAPPWLAEKLVRPARWRVLALDARQGMVGESPWRALRVP
ncbi:MAG: hypothetical protein NZL99_06590 [Burkholderiaceae bacterium]|nr:hypothetical protein [Burkholderiaceae bacterium]